jgi:NH3-dependent NAD+ synthetase
MPVLNIDALLDNRVTAIRLAHIEAKIKRAELDLSGGIDSCVMACLLVLALGPENVTLVHSRFATSYDQTERARWLAKSLECSLVEAALGPVWGILMGEMEISLIDAGYDWDEIQARIDADPTILGSIRSCLRAPIGRGYNRLTGGGIRHGTGNECEDRWLRFYQKGGDGEVDSNPMAMLTKGEVYQLAWLLAHRLPNASDAIVATIKAAPTPDLRPEDAAGYTDEDELLSWTGAPFTYSRIDLETGEYNYVGTIERVSRFLDHTSTLSDGSMATGEKLIFDEPNPVDGWPLVVTLAKTSGLFNDFSRSDVKILLKAARKAEQVTRHKENPNIPTYGSRESLVEDGILTDTLPTCQG